MVLVYTATAVTNLHVGSGDGNYSIVDKQVERDEVTGYPTIYGSSIKGALREHFATKKVAALNQIFGSEEGKTTKPGEVKFLEAKLLALPMRASKGTQSSYLVTTPELLADFITFLALARKADASLLEEIATLPVPSLVAEKAGNVEVEGIAVHQSVKLSPNLQSLLEKAIGKQSLVILSPEDFQGVHLPIRARNNLGENKNLWYEEHVPYGSVFYTLFMNNSFNGDTVAIKALEDELDKSDIIQVGANASVGFGLMSFTKWG